MMALSLRQPWAALVVTGPKRLENRKWNTAFRGTFLIHAAKGMTRDEYEDATFFAHDVDPRIVVPKFEAIERGGIVGRARLVNVIPPCRREAEASLFEAIPCRHPFHMPDQFGFVLEDVEALPFRPLTGALGFFQVEATDAEAAPHRKDRT